MELLLLYVAFTYLYNFGVVYAVTRGFHYPMEAMDHFMLLAAPITFPLNEGAAAILRNDDDADDFDVDPNATA